MSFSFISLAALTVFFSSAAAASLFALLLSKIIRVSFGKHRLSAAALFLSGAVASLALLLIFVPLPGAFSFADAAYYGTIFLLSFFGTLFFRFFGFPLLCAYVLCTLCLLFSLVIWAGKTPSSYEIVLSADSILLDRKPLPLPENAYDGTEKIRLVFSIVKIPAVLPVPFKPLWFRPLGLAGAPLPESETALSSTQFSRAVVFFIQQAGCFLLQHAEKLNSMLAGAETFENVSYYAEIPSADFLPASYSLVPLLQAGKLSFEVTRLL